MVFDGMPGLLLGLEHTERMQSRSLFSRISPSNEEAAGNQTVTVQCGKHYESVISKQEPEHRKEIPNHLKGQGGLPGGGDIVLSLKEHHPSGKKVGQGWGGQGGSISVTGNHLVKR